MKTRILLIIAIVAMSLSGIAQSPNSFNYQSVVRDASGLLLANKNVGVQITILQGSASGTSMYQETFNLNTNDFALVNLKVGDGTVVSGDMSTINWANGPYFMQVAMDFNGGTSFTVMGATELVSVPYALHAKTAENTFSGDYNDLSNLPTNVSVFTNDASYLTTEVDGSVTNEIQTMTYSNDSLHLSNGGDVDLSGYDNSAAIATNATNISTNTSGIATNVTGVSTNTTGITTNATGISTNATAIGTNTTGIATNATSISAHITNDLDTDASNEIQSLTLSGTTLSLSASNSVDLQTASVWDTNSFGAFYMNNVGVGVTNPEYRVHASGDSMVIAGYSTGQHADNWRNVGVYGETQTNSNSGRGVSGHVYGTNSGFAVRGEAATDDQNQGVSGFALSKPGNTINQYGVYGEARKEWSQTNSGTGNHYGGYFTAVGEGNFNIGAQGYANASGTGNNRGLEGDAVSNTASFNIGTAGFGTGSISGTNRGVLGYASNSTTTNYGVHGIATGTTGNTSTGVYGYSDGTTANNTGVDGTTEATGATNIGTGGYAYGTNTGGNKNYGIYAYAQNADTNYGVYSSVTGADNVNYGVYSEVSGGTVISYALFGKNNSTEGTASTDNHYGIRGEAIGVNASAINWGVDGRASGSGQQNSGVAGSSTGNGVHNIAVQGFSTGFGTNNYGVYGSASNATTNYAGYFAGNVTITGNLNVTGSIAKGSGTFKIDHPLDPENKYLVHSFVESDEMMNVYSGNVTTDANGFATVDLPSYFEAANKDFRYQLTVIGSFAQAIIKEEVSRNKFVIQSNTPNVKVSWQVSGVRSDKYADAHRVVPELAKTKKGTYLHPELFGATEEQSENAESNSVANSSETDKNSTNLGIENMQEVLDAKSKTNSVPQTPKAESMIPQGGQQSKEQVKQESSTETKR